MTTFNLISVIISSSLLTGIFGAIANFYLQRENYKRDYYKKIIDKRLVACEVVEKLIGRLTLIVQFENGESCHFFCSEGKELFDKFIQETSLIQSKAFWLNEDVSKKLLEFNVFLLANVGYKIDETKTAHEQRTQLQILGITYRDKIRIFREELEDLLRMDFKDIHNVKGFIKRIRPDYTFELRGKDSRLQKVKEN